MTILKIKRGVESNRSGITPLEGEMIFTTDDKKVYIGDGSTAGGVVVGGVDTSTPGAGVNKTIQYISKFANNTALLMVDNKVYTCAATVTSGPDYCTGRGATGNNPLYGIKNLSEVVIPSSSTVKQVGGNCQAVVFALMEDGELYVWGQNSTGSCGVGSITIVPFPTLAATGVTEVYDHPSNGGIGGKTNVRLIIKKTDGFLYGCGYNVTNGSLGLGNLITQTSFVKLTTLGSSIKGVWNLGATNGALIVQKGDDTIWAAGFNTQGQLGDGTILTKTTHVDVTAAWGGGPGKILKQVITTSSAANGSIGMLLDDGTNTTFRMCGYNLEGQLGDGTLVRKTTPITPNIGSGRIKKIAMVNGQGTVQVLKENNELYAFGRNNEGQIGNGVSNATKVSTPLLILSDVIDIFSDGFTSSASGNLTQSFIKKTDNILYACGYNTYGNLGLGFTSTTENTYQAVHLPFDLDVQEVGYYGTNDLKTMFAYGANGKLFGWGRATNARFMPPTNGPANCLSPVQLDITQDNV